MVQLFRSRFTRQKVFMKQKSLNLQVRYRFILYNWYVTYWRLATQICVSELGNHWYKWSCVANADLLRFKPLKQITVKFVLKYKRLVSWKRIFKYRLQNVDQFVREARLQSGPLYTKQPDVLPQDLNAQWFNLTFTHRYIVHWIYPHSIYSTTWQLRQVKPPVGQVNFGTFFTIIVNNWYWQTQNVMGRYAANILICT